MTRGYQRFRMLFPSSRHSSLGFASVSHLLSSDRPIFLVGLWLVALSCFWFHPNSRSLHQSMATFFFWLQPSSMVTSQPLGIDVPSPPEAIEESLRGTEVCWMEIYILDTPVTTRNFHHCFPMVKNPPQKIQKCRHWKEKTWLFLIGTYWNWLRSTSGNGLSMSFQPVWSPPTLDEKMETPSPTSPILTKVLVHAGALTVQRTVAGTAWVTKIRTSYPQIQ